MPFFSCLSISMHHYLKKKKKKSEPLSWSWLSLWEYVRKYSSYTALSCFVLSLQFELMSLKAAFSRSSVLSLKTKTNIKWPQSLCSIAITGSVQQVERCSHPVGPFRDCQHSSLPRAVAAFLPAICQCPQHLCQ